MKITRPTGRPLHFADIEPIEKLFWLACDREDETHKAWSARRNKQTGGDAYRAWTKAVDQFHDRADRVKRFYGEDRVVEIIALAYEARKKDYNIKKYL